MDLRGPLREILQYVLDRDCVHCPIRWIMSTWNLKWCSTAFVVLDTFSTRKQLKYLPIALKVQFTTRQAPITCTSSSEEGSASLRKQEFKILWLVTIGVHWGAQQIAFDDIAEGENLVKCWLVPQFWWWMASTEIFFELNLRDGEGNMSNDLGCRWRSRAETASYVCNKMHLFRLVSWIWCIFTQLHPKNTVCRYRVQERLRNAEKCRFGSCLLIFN